MKYSFSSMLGAVLLFSGVFAFSACGNDESYPDSTVTIAMATVEKQPQYDAPYFILDNGEKLWVVQNAVPYRDLKTESVSLEVIPFWKLVRVVCL